MTSQKIKNFYYATVGKLSWFNFYRVKLLSRLPRQGRIVLHLGSGHHYIARPGFVNIEGNLFLKKDLWLDFTLGLPFPDNSVDAVFSSHVLEHLYESQLQPLMKECFRVLKPGGSVRFITPHLGRAIQAYVANDTSFFSDFPDARKSIGGKFNNHMLCRDQHFLMFDFGFFNEILSGAGFHKCKEMSPLESRVFSNEELTSIQWEETEGPKSLFVEAVKPAT